MAVYTGLHLSIVSTQAGAALLFFLTLALESSGRRRVDRGEIEVGPAVTAPLLPWLRPVQV